MTRGKEVAKALLASKASADLVTSKRSLLPLKLFIIVVIISVCVHVCVQVCIVYVHVTMSCFCLGNGDKMKSP